MLKYFAIRACLFVLGMSLILTVAFFAIYRLPGDPARMILGPRASAESVAQFERESGLTKSLGLQFLRFSRRMLALNFGISLENRRPVIDLIEERAPQTLILLMSSFAILLLFGMLVPLILRMAELARLETIIQTILSGAAAAPPYVLAILTLTVFAGWAGILPAIFNSNYPQSWVAAGFVLAAYPTALVSRLFNDALQAATYSEYAYRARAQGFSESRIVFFEALLNAITAPVSAIANGLAYFATGTFFVEVAFGIGGIGTLTYNAIRNKDVAVLAAVCFLFAVIISAVSALLEMTQYVLDPKLRRRRGARS